MLSPSPTRLLGGVADALDETVLQTLERGPARNQVQAAIGIVRRCAASFDGFGPLLHAECSDLATSLRSIAEADASVVSDRAAFDDALAAADTVLAETYPPPSALIGPALSLHRVVADVAVTAERSGSTQRSAIRDLLQRMTDRQHELGLSPW